MPADWTKAIIVPVYKGKGRRGEYGSYRGVSLLSIPRKVYGKVIIERVQRLAEEKIGEEQGGFRKGSSVRKRKRLSRRRDRREGKGLTMKQGGRL